MICPRYLAQAIATAPGSNRDRSLSIGHSPDMLMHTYAHALPDSLRAVSDRIGGRVARWSDGQN